MVFFHIIQSYEKNTRIYLLFLVVGRLERPSFGSSLATIRHLNFTTTEVITRLITESPGMRVSDDLHLYLFENHTCSIHVQQCLQLYHFAGK